MANSSHFTASIEPACTVPTGQGIWKRQEIGGIAKMCEYSPALSGKRRLESSSCAFRLSIQRRFSASPSLLVKEIMASPPVCSATQRRCSSCKPSRRKQMPTPWVFTVKLALQQSPKSKFATVSPSRAIFAHGQKNGPPHESPCGEPFFHLNPYLM